MRPRMRPSVPAIIADAETMAPARSHIWLRRLLLLAALLVGGWLLGALAHPGHADASPDTLTPAPHPVAAVGTTVLGSVQTTARAVTSTATSATEPAATPVRAAVAAVSATTASTATATVSTTWAVSDPITIVVGHVATPVVATAADLTTPLVKTVADVAHPVLGSASSLVQGVGLPAGTPVLQASEPTPPTVGLPTTALKSSTTGTSPVGSSTASTAVVPSTPGRPLSGADGSHSRVGSTLVACSSSSHRVGPAPDAAIAPAVPQPTRPTEPAGPTSPGQPGPITTAANGSAGATVVVAAAAYRDPASRSTLQHTSRRFIPGTTGARPTVRPD